MKLIRYISCVFILVSPNSQAVVPHVDVAESQNTQNINATNATNVVNNMVNDVVNNVVNNKAINVSKADTVANTPILTISNKLIPPSIIEEQPTPPSIHNNNHLQERGFVALQNSKPQSSQTKPAPKIVTVDEKMVETTVDVTIDSTMEMEMTEETFGVIDGIVEQPDTIEADIDIDIEADGITNTVMSSETDSSETDIESLLDDFIEPEKVPLQAISPNTLRTFVTVVDLVRREYVEPVNDEQLFADAMQGMLKNLDPHAAFLDVQSYENLQAFTQGELANVGMQVEYDIEESAWVVQSVDDNSPAKNSGIKQGFFLHQINEVQLDRNTLPIDIEQRLKGIAGTMVEVVMSDAGRRKQKYVLQRTLTTQMPIKVALDRGIAVVTIPVFQDNTRQQVLDALVALNTPIHGVVLDIRNNPGGVLGSAVDVAGLFLENQGVVQVEDRVGELTLMSTEGVAYLKEVPLIILQNRYSASAAEVLASGLQFNKRATIVGETSYGKGTVQSVIPIENNQAVKLTVAHYLRPDGTVIEGEGVRVDIPLVRDDHEQFYNNLFNIVDQNMINQGLQGIVNQSNTVGGIDGYKSGLINSHNVTSSKYNVKSQSDDVSLTDVGRAKMRNEWQWQKQAVDILLEQVDLRNSHLAMSNSRLQSSGITNKINAGGFNNNNNSSYSNVINNSYNKEVSPVPLDIDINSASEIDEQLSPYSSIENMNLPESDSTGNAAGLLLVYPAEKN